MVRSVFSPLPRRKSKHETMTDQCFNETEGEEREYLERVKGKIASELAAVSRKVTSRHTEMLDLKTYLQENKADMDHVEKASVRQSADLMSNVVEHGVEQKRRLTRLLDSPYFGRIDVRVAENAATQPTYIGVHSLYDVGTETNLVHD